MTTIIAIHGNGGGAFRFERMLPFVPNGVRFRPITLPGFANLPADPALQSLTDYANHLHGLIKDEPQPLILLGTGIGGTIALEYAQHYDNVAGIILHAPVGTRLATRGFPRLMRLPGMKVLGQKMISSWVLRPIFRRFLFHRPLPKPYVNQFFREYAQCSVFGQMFDIITPDWFDSLRRIDTPTALLWGENERILPVDQLDDYKQLLPNHTVHVEPEWDHFPMIEQPARYTQVMLQLTKKLLA